MIAAVRKNINEPFMSVERSGKPLCTFLLLVNMLNTVFLPNDTFHLKAASLMVLLAVGVRCWFVVDCERTILVYSLAVTSMTIVLSILETGDVVGNIRGGYMGLILLLFPVIKYYRIDFEKMLMNILIIMAYFLLAMAALEVTGVMKLEQNPLLIWLTENGNGRFSNYASSITPISLFLKTSPMLCIAMPYCLRKKRYLSFMAVFLAMFFSGTRANQIISILACGASIVLISGQSAKRVVKVLAGVLVAAIVIYESGLVDYFLQYFEAKASNDAVRKGLFDTIVQGWKDDPVSLVMGTGYTSAIFDPIRKQMMPIVEISYWNLLRQIGLVPFIMMMGMYFYPLIRLFAEKRDWDYAFAYAGYLGICYNDPLLYSTTGMTVLLFMYYVCFSPLIMSRATATVSIQKKKLCESADGTDAL